MDTYAHLLLFPAGLRRDPDVLQVTGSPLSGSVGLEAGDLVLTVTGDIETRTAGQFRALVDEVVAVGSRHVVIDLAAGDFLDASGPTVLLIAAEHLRSTGTQLTVRAVPSQFRQLFELHGLAGAPVAAPPAPSLVSGLVVAAAAHRARAVLDAALKLVVTMAQAVVVGADGVSITLPRNGELGTVAASNDVVLKMDHDQYETREGPCLSAATEGERFHIDSLLKEDRWPVFVPRARARGIESILSTPLLAADRPIGALNVYSRKVGAFAAHEKRWADQFAAEASTVVAAAQEVDPEAAAEQIQEALRSRQIISLAQGVVMHRDGVSADAAYAVLRDSSRRTGEPMRDVCLQVVGGDAVSISGPDEGNADGRTTP